MFKSFRFLKFKFIYFAAKINKHKIFANNIGNIVIISIKILILKTKFEK